MGSEAVRNEERLYSASSRMAGQLFPNHKFGACHTARPRLLTRKGFTCGHADILAVPRALSTYTIRARSKRGEFVITSERREDRRDAKPSARSQLPKMDCMPTM